MIIVKFISFFQENADIAMGIKRINHEETMPKKFILFVSLDRLHKENGNYYWRTKDNKYGVYHRIEKKKEGYTEKLIPHTINTMAFHEFLHACGDSEWLGRKDGLIRLEYIALNSIIDLGTRLIDEHAREGF